MNKTQFSNPNILHNWDFTNPVNQRGKSIYTSKDYTIDRWKAYVENISLKVDSNFVTLTNTGTGNLYVAQIVENGVKTLLNKTLTISLIDSEDVLYTATGTTPTEWPTSNIIIAEITTSWGYWRLQYINSSKHIWVVIGIKAGTSKSFVRAKLEAGAISTLAADPPADYGVELAKCQRYQYVTAITLARAARTTSNEMHFPLPCPVTMRTNPTFTGEFQIYNVANVLQSGFTVARLEGTPLGLSLNVQKTAHGLTDGYIRLLAGTIFDANL